jgi:site-specific DNA-methyltransferase (adenine-specific)
MMKVETISVFSHSSMGHKSLLGDKRMEYFPQGVSEFGKRKITGKEHGRMMGARPNQVGVEYISFTGFPDNVLFYDNHFGKTAIHPTQKPVELCEYLIKTYTMPDAIVLDNCIGSGTTAIACLNTNRHYIGMEKD